MINEVSSDDQVIYRTMINVHPQLIHSTIVIREGNSSPRLHNLWSLGIESMIKVQTLSINKHVCWFNSYYHLIIGMIQTCEQ